MVEVHWGFPIMGSNVSDLIRSSFGAGEVWQIFYMDVPSGAQSPPLLDQLRERMESGRTEISTTDLCDALVGAPQVWVLDMRLASDNDVQLYIEDGEVFEMKLERR
jgi:hypothetical protein